MDRAADQPTLRKKCAFMGTAIKFVRLVPVSWSEALHPSDSLDNSVADLNIFAILRGMDLAGRTDDNGAVEADARQ